MGDKEEEKDHEMDAESTPAKSEYNYISMRHCLKRIYKAC
jgi:hypothetical protein